MLLYLRGNSAHFFGSAGARRRFSYILNRRQFCNLETAVLRLGALDLRPHGRAVSQAIALVKHGFQPKSFRIHTYRMNAYKKHREVVQLLLTRIPNIEDSSPAGRDLGCVESVAAGGPSARQALRSTALVRARYFPYPRIVPFLTPVALWCNG